MTIENIQLDHDRSGRRLICVLAILVAVLGLTFQARAASVLQTGLGEMLHASELVFEGRVTAIEPRSDSQRKFIRTYVTFDVLDVIKGSYAGPTVEISFLGGSVNGRTLRVAELTLPKTGSTGIFFVESLSRQQVHPLYGWSQGHIVITSDSQGIRRVVTEAGRPIVAVAAEKKRTLTTPVPSTGAAYGLRVDPEGQISDAMRVDAFKHALGDLLGSSASISPIGPRR